MAIFRNSVTFGANYEDFPNKENQNLGWIDQSLAGEPIGEDEDNKQDDEAD